MRIAYITAGGAGMYCGSCMHDNTLAAALIPLGCDVQLIPTFTPIRTDEENVSIDQVFFGGINIYLQEKIPLFRYLPRVLDHWLDRPWLIDYLASRAAKTDAGELGALTVSMLRGEIGHQRKEVRRLTDYLANHARPQLVNLSNLLIGGCIPAIKRKLHVPLIVTLQGDDLFLNDLKEPYHSQALTELIRLAKEVDAFIVYSHYYADYMANLLELPNEKIHVLPLGLKTDGYPGELPTRSSDTFTLGYFARHCPAKGFHLMIDAFRHLRRSPDTENVRLRSAGWLGESDRNYFQREVAKLTEDGLHVDYEYAGVLDREQKINFLSQLDVLSVPTTYREPKGLFVLEALAAGIPVVLPEHGAFPELISATGGGVLVPPERADLLAKALLDLRANKPQREQLRVQGHRAVHERFHADAMAQQTLACFRKIVGANTLE